ncbi:uncharacterized protein [Pempheris klunzingeri]|uniref:uncharacterized protein n=1 Tax=Pempheris klunzingeri TaxID=3127111 RepID=UPI003980BC0E
MSCQWDEDRFDESDGEDQPGFSDLVSDTRYVMYHGTTRKNAKAIQDKGFRRNVFGVLGHGIYLSRDLDKASRYPLGHSKNVKVVIKVVVDVGKVICIDHRGHTRRKTWHDSRYGEVYDTAWVPPECGVVADDLEMACVLDPDRIEFIEIIPPGDIDSNMPYEWSMADCDLPSGIFLRGNSAPLSGKTYVMYHGTTREAAQSIRKTGFRPSEDGMLGRGVYLSKDLNKAKRYPIKHPESDKVVIKVKVNVGRVIVIKYNGHPRQKNWHDPEFGDVYDTAWVPPNCNMVPSGLEENCVWDPDRIQIIKIFKPHLI